MSKANTVTQDQIDALMDQAEYEECIFFRKNMVVCAKLPNGFTVIGSGSCVDPTNFDENIGRTIAKEQIKNKIWELEGYALQQLLIQAKAQTQVC